jgi:hypothetical protein
VVVQDEDGSLVERKRAERLLQLVAVGDRVHVGGPVHPIDREDPDRRRPLPVARRFRVAGVDENPARPGVETLGIPEMRQLPPDGHEGVLQDVLGEARIAQDSSSDPEERVAGLVHQRRERLLVARASPLDEVSVHLTIGCEPGRMTRSTDDEGGITRYRSVDRRYSRWHERRPRVRGA